MSCGDRPKTDTRIPHSIHVFDAKKTQDLSRRFREHLQLPQMRASIRPTHLAQQNVSPKRVIYFEESSLLVLVGVASVRATRSKPGSPYQKHPPSIKSRPPSQTRDPRNRSPPPRYCPYSDFAPYSDYAHC